MIGANTIVGNAARGLSLLLLLQPAEVHSFVHSVAGHNEKTSHSRPYPSLFMGRTKPSKAMTRLQYKEDGFTTGPFGQPATSSEEDIELTRQVILNHIAGEMCQMKVLQEQHQPTAEASAGGSSVSDKDASTAHSVVSPESASTLHVTKKNKKRKFPSNKDVQLTRQVILDHIAKEMSGANNDHNDLKPAVAESPKVQPPQQLPSEPSTKAPNQSKASNPSVHRAGVLGVSISPIGFLLLLSTSHQLPKKLPEGGGSGTRPQSKMVVPLRISSAPNDATTTNSTEALTTIQLLWGIDMAAAGVLEPEALQTLVALYCSEDDESDQDNSSPPPLEDDRNPEEEDCIIAIEDELGLGSFEPSNPSTLVSDSVGNLRLVDESSDTIALVNNVIARSLSEDESFEEASTSSRAKVVFPTMTLDQVRIESIMPDAVINKGASTAQHIGGIGMKPPPLKLVLEITVAGSSRLEIPLYSETTSLEELVALPAATKAEIETSSSILRELSLSFDPDVSANFMALALALRYKVPITVSADLLDILAHQFQSDNVHAIPAIVTSGENYNTAISRLLPDWRSLTDLREQSQRVSQNINQSYEVHKLQGALRIATERGDTAAIEKIRAALDKLDDFDDLPTAEPSISDRNKDEGDSDDHESGPCSI